MALLKHLYIGAADGASLDSDQKSTIWTRWRWHVTQHQSPRRFQYRRFHQAVPNKIEKSLNQNSAQGFTISLSPSPEGLKSVGRSSGSRLNLLLEAFPSRFSETVASSQVSSPVTAAGPRPNFTGFPVRLLFQSTDNRSINLSTYHIAWCLACQPTFS